MFERVIERLKMDIISNKEAIKHPYRANAEECIAIWKEEINELQQAISILEREVSISQK